MPKATASISTNTVQKCDCSPSAGSLNYYYALLSFSHHNLYSKKVVKTKCSKQQAYKFTVEPRAIKNQRWLVLTSQAS